MSAPGPLMIDVAGTRLDAPDRALLAEPLVGGVILFSRNFASVAQLGELCAEIREQRPDLLIAADYEGGRVQRFHNGMTRIPPMSLIGARHDVDPDAARALATDCGRVIGAELAALDIDLAFAPVLDRDYGCSTVIGDRAFHADGGVVAALGGALRAGMAQAGLAATGKHFPGHGAVVADSHETLPVDERPLADLQADMAPFAALIAAGLESVMMAHVRYPAVSDEVASLCPAWIGERLRGELGFTGVVFCDDLSMGGAAVVGDYLTRARKALAAGCQMLPVCNNREAVMALCEQLPLPTDFDPAPLTRLRRRNGTTIDESTLAAARSRVAALARPADGQC